MSISSKFVLHVKKLMEPKRKGDKRLRNQDVVRLTGGRVNKQLLSEIMHGKTPWDISIIDALSKGFQIEPQILRDLAAVDWIHKVTEHFKAEPSRVLRKPSQKAPLHETSGIPWVLATDLAESFAEDGSLPKSARMFHLGEFAPGSLAVTVKDNTLYPKANYGDVCIVEPARRANTGDYGFVITKSGKVLSGRFQWEEKWSQITVEQTEPDYNTFTAKRRDIRFLYRITGVFEANDVGERRGPP